MGEEPKKDLTSIIDLAAAADPSSVDPALAAIPTEKATEEDFGNLEEMSRDAAAAADATAHGGSKAGFEQIAPVETPPETPAFEAPPPAETPVPAEATPDSHGGAGEAMPSFLDDQSEAPAIHVNETPPAAPEPVPVLEAGPFDMGTQTAVAPAKAALEPSKSPLDPNRPPVKAPPAGADQSVKAKEAPTAKQDLSAVKKFADKFAIGKPRIEGAPAFSLLARNNSGTFDEKTIKAIEDALTSEDFGVRMEDVRVQLSTGKLLVPQISEFAAITLAQKLRDAIDVIDIDLAGEIFKSSSNEISGLHDSFLVDTEEFESHREEVHDLGAEPGSESDLFTTNLPELSDYQVTRILSVVTASEIIEPAIAENPASKAFETATEKLTQQLVHRAFKLGAHGVLGINFTLKAIEIYKDSTGNMGRAYRLMGTGTAVRVRQRS